MVVEVAVREGSIVHWDMHNGHQINDALEPGGMVIVTMQQVGINVRP